MVTRAFLAGVALAALATSQAHATLDCSILVDGASVGTCTTSTTGAISFDSTAASPLFSSISLTANGSPDLPQPDLSSVTLDVSTSGTFTGTHTLTVDLFQSAISVPAGTTILSTATINTLIGTTMAGPTTLGDFINGSNSTLGNVLRSATFPVEATGTIGPFTDVVPAVTANAQQYIITFSGPDQSANDTIQMQGVIPGVPEPRSLPLLAAGLGLMGLWRWRGWQS